MTFRLQKVSDLDRPPKTLTLYEEDGIRMRTHRYVLPVRCIDCKRSFTEKAGGTLRRYCTARTNAVRDDGWCDEGVRRG